MLLKRVITALILFPLVMGLVFYVPTVYFEIITGFLLLLVAREWSLLCGANRLWMQFIYCLATLGLLYLCAMVPLFYIYLVASLFWVLSAIWICLYPKGSCIWNNYPVIRYLMGFLVLLPLWFAMNQVRKSSDGHVHLFLLFLIVWSTDIGAYFVGRFFGQHKLLANVSPNKTREGFYGGLICAFATALIYVWFFDMELLASSWFVLLVMITALFAVIGDLTESMIKRLSGVKDSGTWLPGHGGLLDRVDSLLAAGPIYALILWNSL